MQSFLRKPEWWSRLLWAAAALSLLPAGSVSAQRAAAPSVKAEAAHAAWRKLSQGEVNCVDKALRARNSQIWMLIERGVGPTDASVTPVRAGCRISSASAHNTAPARTERAVAVHASGSAQDREYWSFNGSVLKMVTDGNLRKFFYFQPDAEAEAVGAVRGELFLEGKVSDQRFVGTVYGFEGRCGRVPYRVDGAIRDGNRRLELQGQRPRVDGQCTVVGTVLDALTFRSVDATATAAVTPAAKPEAAKAGVARADVAKPDGATRSAIEKAAAVMAAADPAAVDKAEAEDAAEFKVAPGRAAPDRPGTANATPVRVVTATTSESKLAVNEAVAEKASAETAVEIARAEAVRAQAEADRARNDAEKAIAEAMAMVASAQSRIGFFYGLMTGPAVLGMGVLAFWLWRRRRQPLAEPAAAA